MLTKNKNTFIHTKIAKTLAYIVKKMYLCSKNQSIMKHTLLLLFALGILQPIVGKQTTIDSLLTIYDQEIAQANKYITQREIAIDAARQNFQNNPSADNAYLLAELFAPYRSDSAITYYEQALRLCREEEASVYESARVAAEKRAYGEESFYTRNDSSIVPAEDTHDYAIYAYERSIEAREAGQEEEYIEWLTRSAIADVRSAITDNASSWMLAKIVLDRGDVERAYSYIIYSIDNACTFNAHQRYVQINPLYQLITTTWQQRQADMSRRLAWTLAAVLALLLALIVVVAYTLRQYRHLQMLNERQVLLNGELQTLNAQLSSLNRSLKEASIVKEQYICLYLQVYSEYIQRLTKMARKAGEKDPDAFLNKEMAEFYRSFDRTFLSIYRTFVTDFNALLKPEEQIVPKQGELLTTELRIFALIRLGIDSSAKIAELLCYSPNTIYNYRARVKNCAKGNREEFEDIVKRL